MATMAATVEPATMKIVTSMEFMDVAMAPATIIAAAPTKSQAH